MSQRTLVNRTLLSGLLVAGTLGLNACSDNKSNPITPVPTPTPVPGAKTAMLVGTVTGSRTLSADTTYTLRGKVKIAPGAVLNVPAGTLVQAEPGSFLITQRGTTSLPSGRLEAVGTAAKPIVFTSTAVSGAKSTGQWGGIILVGLAQNNQPGGTAFIEGDENPDAYGWGGVLSAPKNDDNSGTLKYVIVEFGGFEIRPGSEINGITFYAVGNGTTIDYVQSHYNNDDGFEFFGGTVNLKHCISSGNSDDSFDFDNGYQGNAQYMLAVQRTGASRFARGHEMDNNADGTDVQPFTQPTWANVTLIGSGSTSDKQGTDGDPNDGIYARRSTRGKFYNYLIYNFGGLGMSLDIEKGAAARVDKNVEAGELFIKNSLLSSKRGNLASGKPEIAVVTKTNGVYSEPGATIAGRVAGWNDQMSAVGSAALSLDPKLTGFKVADNNNVPNLTLAAGSPALSLTGAVEFPTAAFFDQSGKAYIGAFGSGASADWTAGWAHWQTR